jgi:hypothetical protein
MSVEQKLRDNLKAAADALVVPQPRPAPLSHRATSRKRGPLFALAGAAAVLALALPALVLWSGSGSSSEPSSPGTDPSIMAGTTDVPETSVPTTTTQLTPSTTLAAPAIVGATATLGEIIVDDYSLVLVATQVDDEDPPTATVILQTDATGGSEPLDEIVVGPPAGFFWYSVTGEGGVCEFAADQTEDGVQVIVQPLLSPSLGCSEPYNFLLDGGDLTPNVETPEGVAQQFAFSWVVGDEETMADLADPAALAQAREMSIPAEPTFSYCEGAAGSVYCTFEVLGGELVIRVRSERPAQVVEVFSFSD